MQLSGFNIIKCVLAHLMIYQGTQGATERQLLCETRGEIVLNMILLRLSVLSLHMLKFRMNKVVG